MWPRLWRGGAHADGALPGGSGVKKGKKSNGLSRRDFMRAAVVGAGAFALPTVIVPRGVVAFEQGQAVHPNISPLRTVGIEDARMIAGNRTRINWLDQEKMLDAKQIAEDIDRLACALAEEKKVKDAWAKILIKPPAKDWSDVVVAIKTNNIAQQHTRSPVMAKVCHVLTDELGVPGANVHIYDARHGGNLAGATPFAGLPKGVTIENDWGGINTAVPIPAPWKEGKRSTRCVGPVARGEVDIIINIAVCKGHSSGFGAFTMCAKNHFGTFNPGPGHRDGATDYLLSINKSEALLGQMDKATGRVLFPRQQLCLIDALWASRGGPDGLPDAQPNRLFMGTFAPVLDYQVATRLRRATMNWPLNQTVADRFLTEFGFTAEDLPEDGAIIDAMA